MLVFFFAAFARLNRDYHDTRKSATTVLFMQILDGTCEYSRVRRWLVDLVSDKIWLVALRVCILAVEFGGWVVPIALWRGNVALGLLVAWLACFVGATTSTFDFSCVLVATMVFWVPPQYLLTMRWMTLDSSARFGTLALGVGVLAPVLLQCLESRSSVRLAAAIWLLAASPLQYVSLLGKESLAVHSMGVQLCAGEMAQHAVHSSTYGFVHFVGWLTVCIALLNGAAPYIGLKTQGCWTMFTNLHVEGGRSNHMLVPADCQVFGYAAETITVTKSNVPLLQDQHLAIGGTSRLGAMRGVAERLVIQARVHSSFALSGEIPEELGDALSPYSMPWYELRRVIGSQTLPILSEFSVDYVHYGAPHRFEVQRGVPSRSSDALLASVQTGIFERLLAFRSVPAATDDEDVVGVAAVE